MRARLAVAALAALGLGTGAQAAPSYDGNFTARDCAVGGGFLYCGSGSPGGTSAGAGFGGMFFPGFGAFAPRGPSGPAFAKSGAQGPGAAGGTGSPGATGAGGSGATGSGGSGGTGSGGVNVTDGSAFLPPTETDTGNPVPPDEEVAGLPPPTTLPQTPVTSVPEPGALALFGAALALLGLTRVRARAHARV